MAVGAIPQPLLDGIAAIGTAAEELGTYVQELRDKAKENMTPEEVTELRANMDLIATRLRDFKLDPNNPTPVPVFNRKRK